MTVSKQGGFTIVEVSLYLAISAALAAALMGGLVASMRNQEWQDTLVQMRNLVQSQYQNVANNINHPASGASNAGKSSSLLIGRYLQFTPNSANYTTGTIVANNANIAGSGGDISALNNSGLTTADSSSGVLPWNNKFANIYNLKDQTQSFNTLAIMRSPLSGAVYVFALSSLNFNALSSPNLPLGLAIYNGNSSTGGALCIAGGSSSSNIIFAAPVTPNTAGSVISSCNKIGVK